MNRTHLVLLSALLGASLPAQVAPTNGVRPTQVLSTANGNNDNVQVEMPHEELVAPPGSIGFVHTGRLAYAAFEDDVGGSDAIFIRRSTDGGCSFGPPQVVWTGVSGESIFLHRLVATEHHVFLALETERDSQGLSPTTDEYCWVLGSDQQGQPGTWQEVLVSTGQDQLRSDGSDLDDVSSVRAAGGHGRCYVAFDANYNDTGAGSSTNNDDVFFRVVEFVNGTLTARGTESIRLNSLAAGTSDIDFPLIDADGDTVAITWRENRSGIDDDQWVRVSLDGGVTFQGEENLTNFATSVGQEVGSIAVGGQNVYVVSTDERNTNIGAQDQVFLSFSSGGAPGSFQTARVDSVPAGSDADVGQVAAAGDIVYVFYESDIDDELFVNVSNAGGAQFLNGTSTETQITSNSPDTILTISNVAIPTADAVGSVCAFPVIRDSDPSVFDVAFTRDGGQTWELRNINDAITSGGRTFDRDVAVGTRNEILVALQNRAGGFDALLTGIRLGVLEYDNAQSLFTMSTLPRPDLTHVAILLPSLQAPNCGALVLSPDGSWQSDLTPDGLTPDAFTTPGFIAVATPGNDAVWQFPNFATLLGVPIYFVGASVQSPGGAILSVSDTIVQMP